MSTTPPAITKGRKATPKLHTNQELSPPSPLQERANICLQELVVSLKYLHENINTYSDATLVSVNSNIRALSNQICLIKDNADDMELHYQKGRKLNAKKSLPTTK